MMVNEREYIKILKSHQISLWIIETIVEAVQIVTPAAKHKNTAVCACRVGKNINKTGKIAKGPPGESA